MGRKKPLCRDTLATTARGAKSLAIINMRRERTSQAIDWPTLHGWGYRCVPITVSYSTPRKT
jgi:hypothetical protein